MGNEEWGERGRIPFKIPHSQFHIRRRRRRKVISDSLQHLYVHPGVTVLAEHHNALVRELERRQILAGNGVRTRQLDSGIIISYSSAGGNGVSHAWQPSAGLSRDGKPCVSFSKGLVNGIEPKIGEMKISDDECVPLEIPEYNDAGDCWLFVELKLNSFWQIEKAEMKAYAKPEWKAWTARKLVAIAQKDGGIEPRARFDFGFYASERKPSGTFRQWWWAMS
jgi:hypothetical protein